MRVEVVAVVVVVVVVETGLLRIWSMFLIFLKLPQIKMKTEASAGDDDDVVVVVPIDRFLRRSLSRSVSKPRRRLVDTSPRQGFFHGSPPPSPRAFPRQSSQL